MNQETVGTVLAVKRQWWLKINTKCFRTSPFDGAVFPYVIKVEYTVDGKDYVKRKWIHAGDRVPSLGEKVTVTYLEEKPSKAKISL